MPAFAVYDVASLLRLLGLLSKHSRGEDVTIAKLARYSKQNKGLRYAGDVLKYMRYAAAEGLVRIMTVKDPRPAGIAKYYFLTPAGAAFLQAWQESKKEVLKKNGN
jgi:hypothetical protein